MKKITFLFSCLIISTVINAQAVEWVKQGKAPKAEQGNAITHDNDGNIYITGTFQDSVRFDNILLTTSFGDYCAKYDTLGNVIWAKKNIGGEGIQFDGNDHLYTFSKSGKTLKKLDLNGNTIWSKTLYTTSNFGSDAIVNVFPKDNDVYVTGYFSYDAYFGNDTLTNRGGWDAYIAKFDVNGQNIWATSIGSSALDKGYDIYVNNMDELYAVGYFNDTAYFDATQVISSGSADAFLAKYDENGDLVWVNSYGTPNFDLAARIVADENEDIYITGRYTGDITFGSTTLTSVNSDAYIAKFDNGGNSLWAKSISGQLWDEEADIFYKNGVLAVMATTDGDVEFNGITYDGLGSLDFFIGNLDQSGNTLWAKIFGGSASDEASGITLINGSTYFTGSFHDVADFDSYQLTSLGNWDIVTGKINPQLTTGIFSSTSAVNGLSIYPNPTNNILIVEVEDYTSSILEINTLEGKMFKRIPLLNNKTIVDLTFLNSGIYLFKIHNNNGITNHKVVKN